MLKNTFLFHKTLLFSTQNQAVILFLKISLMSLLLHIISIHVSYAQCKGLAKFSVDKTRGCAPLTINTIDESGGNNIGYIYDYNDCISKTTDINTCIETGVTEHTYTVPGVYKIMQAAQFTIGSTTCGDTTFRYVEVLETPVPVYSISFCANRVVSLTIENTDKYEEYKINWGDGSPVETVIKPTSDPAPTSVSVNHTYLINPSNQFSLTITGNYNPGDCGASTSPVLISPLNVLPPPVINSLIVMNKGLTDGRIEIKMNTNQSFNYELYQNAGSSPVKSFSGTGAEKKTLIENLNTKDNNFCYKVKIFDKCGNSAESGSIYCSINLQMTTQDSQNRIDWNTGTLPSADFQEYILYRNGQVFRNISTFNTSQFIDTDVTCNREYCYKIEAKYNTDFSSTSNPDCGIAFSKALPPRLIRFNSTVETPRSIKLFWELEDGPKVVEYRINRFDKQFISKNTTLEVIDTDLKINQRFCYEMVYFDECGNASFLSNQTCPVFLQNIPAQAGQVKIGWTAYRNGEGLFQNYILEKIDENGDVYEEINLPGFILNYEDTKAKTDRQIIKYRIKTVIDSQNNIYSYSNIIEVRQKFRIFFPNAFSPNGDTHNDIFKPTYLFVKNYKMTIYNRAGEIVFSSVNIEDGWDGFYKGTIAPQEVYIYTVDMEDFTGEKFNTKGTFTLIR